MRSVKALLLDADDTLFDFSACERAALSRTFDMLNIEYDSSTLDTYHEINIGVWKALERGECDRVRIRTLRFERLAEVCRMDLDPAEVNATYGRLLAHEHILFDGARDFLERARKKWKLYMITNGITEVQQKRLKDSAIDEFFDGIFISEQIGYDKPNKLFFDEIWRRTGLTPDDCMVLGDSLTSDIAGAQGSGMRCCLYAPQGGQAPCHVVRSYGEFLEYMEEQCL